MKYLNAVWGTLLFVAVLGATYFVHVRFLRVDVVFYSALLDGLIAAAVTALLLFNSPPYRTFSRFEKLQLALIWILMGYSFAISVPTVIDRSLSFYFLEKIQQRGGGIRQSAFEKVFTEEYSKEHRLVDVRLTEQLKSGTLYIENGCVKLTERGSRLADFSRFFRRNLLPRHRLLMGEYTDELTDPFRRSTQTADYSCSGG